MSAKSTTEFFVMPANEEAHWTSFRGAIADLQLTLLIGLGSNINNSNHEFSYQHAHSFDPQDMSAFRSGGNAILMTTLIMINLINSN